MTAPSGPGATTRPDCLIRKRLLAALDRESRVVLLRAPAGFGKTTLAATWLADRSMPAEWLALGRDPAAQVLSRLASARDRVVVLDDYQDAADPDIHRAVDAFLADGTGQGRLVICSRSRPPVTLSALRARGELLELRAQDLRFTTEETAEFLARCGAEIAPREVSLLTTKTGGWPAALRLAAASLAGAKNRPAVVARFGGSTRHVADYLGDEVLRRLPLDRQELLLRTCILGRVTAGACAALTGRSDCQEILEELEEDGAFIDALDDERSAFRWQPLFAEVLRSRLARSPLDAGELHRRAAGWWESQGVEEEAVRHRLADREFEAAARLIDTVAEKVLRGGRSTTFLGWVDALPGTARDGHPSLGVYHDLAMAVAESAEGSAPSGDPLVDGGRAAARAFAQYAACRMEACVTSAETALSILPEDRSWLRGTAGLLLAGARLLMGEMDAAALDLALLLPRARRDGNIATATECLQRLFLLELSRGRPARARAHAEEALRLAFEGAAAFSARSTLWFLCALARLQVLAGNAAECGVALGRARLVAAEAGVPAAPWLQESEVALLLLEGDREGAAALAGRSERSGLAPRDASPEAREDAARCAALCLRAGELESALAWISLAGVDGLRQDLASGLGFPRVPYRPASRDLILAAHIALARGEAREARTVADLVAAEADGRGDMEALVECRVIAALALDALGEPCDEVLAGAAEIAVPAGLAGLLVLAGPRLAALLYPLCSGPHAAAAGAVLALFPAADHAGACREKPGALVEPLSTREIEILRLLAAGCSNREIADRIFVSEKTVKWHATNIYGKLGAARRTQAVARARSLGILPSGPEAGPWM